LSSKLSRRPRLSFRLIVTDKTMKPAFYRIWLEAKRASKWPLSILTISERLNLLKPHEISTTQRECLAKMARTREFSKKVKNEDFQSRPSNKVLRRPSKRNIKKEQRYF
jgi:hypothetical protein